jgi:hypothetical protein
MVASEVGTGMEATALDSRDWFRLSVRSGLGVPRLLQYCV